MKRKGRTWRGKARKKERKEDATRSERKTLFSPLLFRGDGLSPSIQISPMYPRSRISREKNLSLRILFLSSYANKDDHDDETKFPF